MHAAAVGIPADYAYTWQGCPQTSDSINVGNLVTTALEAAIQGQGDLQTMLASAQQRLNASAAAPPRPT